MNHQLSSTAAIVLAAGRGTRMKAKSKNKVAFRVNGQPMIAHAVTHLREAKVGQIIAVVGFQAESVKKALGSSVTYVTQSEPLGTGDALKTALPQLNPHIKTVLSVYGDDSAFYPAKLYQDMINQLITSHSDLLFLTIHKANPTGLGRIVRDSHGQIVKIVEEKNATPEEKMIQEINTGFYCFKREFLDQFIGEIHLDSVSQEYYLTDLVEIALSHGKKVDALYIKDDSIWHGVNTRSDYARALRKINP